MIPPLPNSPDPTASNTRRFLNYAIDSLVFLIGMLFLINPLMRAIFGNSLLKNFWINYLFTFFLQVIYYVFFESLFQKTPGKFITGTKVTTEDGSKPDFGTIVKRTLIRFVPCDAISIYTGQNLSKKGTWWHDRWTSTKVTRRANQAESKNTDIVIPIISSPEPDNNSSSSRSLLTLGAIFLGFITITSAGALLLLIFSAIFIGTRWTGNFWDDIFPFILSAAITGGGLFGVIKLIQINRKKA